MLTKILFTLAVIIVVIVFLRHKQGRAPEAATADGWSLPPRIVAYGLIGVLAAASAVIFVLHWQAQNRIVHLRVISDGAAATIYQARYKSIRGRNFVTLDGARVTLGESDRIEMIEP